MNTSTRRLATEADLTVGATVYKGNGPTAYRIVSTRREQPGSRERLLANIVKATTKGNPKGSPYAASLLTVEA